MADEQDLRADLASAALGRLSDAERVALEARLEGDPAARAELAELSATVDLLGLADVSRLDDEPRPSPDLADRIAAAVAADELTQRRHRRRRRLLQVAGAAVAVAAVLVAVLLLAQRDSAPELESFALVPEGAEVEFALEATASGTEITLRTEGLDPAVVYWLWLSPTDDPEDRIAAGTFRGTAAGEATLKLFAGLAVDDAVRIWITTPDGVVADSDLA
jgi:hypothetical protein